MTVQTPQVVAETFFHRIATAEDVNEIAALVSESVDWVVAGNTQLVPGLAENTAETVWQNSMRKYGHTSHQNILK